MSPVSQGRAHSLAALPHLDVFEGPVPDVQGIHVFVAHPLELGGHHEVLWEVLLGGGQRPPDLSRLAMHPEELPAPHVALGFPPH